MVIVAHVSYDSVLVGTGKQKGLESLSENGEWRRRCDVERHVVPDGGHQKPETCMLVYLGCCIIFWHKHVNRRRITVCSFYERNQRGWCSWHGELTAARATDRPTAQHDRPHASLGQSIIFTDQTQARFVALLLSPQLTCKLQINEKRRRRRDNFAVATGWPPKK